MKFGLARVALGLTCLYMLVIALPTKTRTGKDDDST